MITVMGKMLLVFALFAIVWLIVDVWDKQNGLTMLHKVSWTFVALLFNILAAVVYYYLVKRKDKRI